MAPWLRLNTLNPFLPPVCLKQTEISATSLTPGSSSSTRSRTTVGRVWTGTMDNHPKIPAARRCARTLGLGSASREPRRRRPDGTVCQFVMTVSCILSTAAPSRLVVRLAAFGSRWRAGRTRAGHGGSVRIGLLAQHFWAAPRGATQGHARDALNCVHVRLQLLPRGLELAQGHHHVW